MESIGRLFGMRQGERELINLEDAIMEAENNETSAVVANSSQKETKKNNTQNPKNVDGTLKNLSDIATKNGLKKRRFTAANHFENFLQYDNFGKTMNQLTYDDLKEEVFDRFSNYLVNFAYLYGKERLGVISCASACAYLSSTRMSLIKQLCKDKILPPCFQEKKWETFHKSVVSTHVERCKQNGTRLVRHKAMATDEDLGGLGCLCLWDGSAEAAEFWHVITAGTHESGRITEVSYTKKENLSLISCNEHGAPFKVIGSGLDRHKTGTSGEHHIFPHVNNPFLCFYLTLAYTLVVSSGISSQYVLKTFSEEALKEDENGKKKVGAASERFGRLISKLLQSWAEFSSKAESKWSDVFEELGDDFDINPDLGSHCAKKRGINRMAECQLEAFAIIFRGGWETRNLHTLFDYLFGNKQQDRNAGKVSLFVGVTYIDMSFLAHSASHPALFVPCCSQQGCCWLEQKICW